MLHPRTLRASLHPQRLRCPPVLGQTPRSTRLEGAGQKLTYGSGIWVGRFADMPEAVQDYADMAVLGNGLVNLGNTCYMNSTLQCLHNNSDLNTQLTVYSAPATPANSLAEQAGSKCVSPAFVCRCVVAAPTLTLQGGMYEAKEGSTRVTACHAVWHPPLTSQPTFSLRHVCSMSQTPV